MVTRFTEASYNQAPDSCRRRPRANTVPPRRGPGSQLAQALPPPSPRAPSTKSTYFGLKPIIVPTLGYLEPKGSEAAKASLNKNNAEGFEGRPPSTCPQTHKPLTRNPEPLTEHRTPIPKAPCTYIVYTPRPQKRFYIGRPKYNYIGTWSLVYHKQTPNPKP